MVWQACAVAFETDTWLVVLDQQPTEEALRAYWNVKDEDTLTLVSAADRLWLGQTRAITPDEPEAPGPAGKVSDLLGLIGTLPHYNAPLITPELTQRVMVAFESGDEGEMPAVDPGTLRAFLDANLGKFLLFDG
jgi:hypothetical protein